MIKKNCLVFVFFIFSSHAFSFNFKPETNSIAVGSGPTGLAVTPNGSLVYVANKNSNSVTVIDSKTNKTITTITGFDEPNSVTVNPSGTKAYVTNSRFSGANTISIIDIATQTISAAITGFNAPCAMVVTSDGKFGYVANYGNPVGVPDNTVRYVDLTTNLIVGSAIVVGNYPVALALTPDNSYLYVSNYMTGLSGSGTISVVDTNSSHVTTFNTVIKTITGLFGPRQIAINASGTYAYVVNYGNNFVNPATSSSAGTTVSVVAINSNNSSTFNTIVQNITVGLQPSGIVIAPAGNYAYVTLYNNGAVGSLVTIQLSDNTVLSPSVSLAKGPIGVALLPNGLSVYVSNYIDNTVKILFIKSTLVISVFNIPLGVSLPVYLSNIYPVTPCGASMSQNDINVFGPWQLTSNQYSIYMTLAQLLAKPQICSAMNPVYTPICGPVLPQKLRILVSGILIPAPFGGALMLKPSFYFDIYYSNIVSGANSFVIDFPSKTAQFFTSSGTKAYIGQIYVTPDTYTTCE
ncbi:YncE family protein [Candidatus Dependentiae bacterium]|nr:YncE family protein [Candidatus Dependentiae bacterium]